MQRTPESCDTLCLKTDVWCVFILLFILTKTKTCCESRKKHCRAEKSHDPKARQVVIKGLEIQIPLATVRRRRRRTKFKRPVEKVQKTRGNLCVKSCKESANRESEKFKKVGSLTDDAKVEDGDRGRIRKTLMQLREEEYEACALLEDMQKNVQEAHARASNQAETVSGARGVHLLMGPRIWKTTEHQ